MAADAEYVVSNAYHHVTCLPPRSREAQPTMLSEETARAMLARAEDHLRLEISMGLDARGRPRWNPMLEERYRGEVESLRAALDDFVGKDLLHAREQVSKAHPDHGGPGGATYIAAVKRMKRAKKSGAQPNAA